MDSTPDTAPRAYDGQDAEDYLEPWVDWVKRATRKAEAAMEKLRITDWVSKVRLRRWHWIRELANTSEHEWTRQVFQWTPERDPVYTAKRRVGRPKLRWIDDVRHYIGITMGRDGISIPDILCLASTAMWDDLAPDFAAYDRGANQANTAISPRPRRRTRSTSNGLSPPPPIDDTQSSTSNSRPPPIHSQSSTSSFPPPPIDSTPPDQPPASDFRLPPNR